MKKRPFLLVEALVALTLMILCAVPLVKQPLKLYNEEIAFLHKMELERLADWTFTEVKELLLKNEIPWEEIPDLWGKTGPFPLDDASIQVPGCQKKNVRRSFLLSTHGAKTSVTQEEYRLIWIKVMLNEAHYWFRIPIQKLVVE